jgi:hypothetical protein
MSAINNTAYSIISGAMWKACIIPEGEDPDSEELAKYIRTLNQYVNFVQTMGIRLWLLEDMPIPLTVGKGVYVLGPSRGKQASSIPDLAIPNYTVSDSGATDLLVARPLQVEDQYYLYPPEMGATRRPVFKISRQEWDMLSVTQQLGPITQIFVDPQQFILQVNTWLIPDQSEARGTLHLVLRMQVANFIEITDRMGFPLEWALTLEWGLAQQICQGQPPAVIQRCDAMAAYHLQKLEEWDAEHGTSILPRPDQRMFQGSQRFRSGGWR